MSRESKGKQKVEPEEKVLRQSDKNQIGVNNIKDKKYYGTK